ncbi:MAG: efflux RND transporter periplasmic adaptor subunit [Fimbriimonas sp.]|nr:efflux RND transporter periplasmic adaptor subunit [Fimbriimonas sp.]
MSNEQSDMVSEVPVKRKRPRIVPIVVLVVVAAVGGYRGYESLVFGWSHATTDDAYVTGDLVNVGPTVPGTLVELNVQDGQYVHRGDPIAKLDTSGPQAEVAQAEANLLASKTQVPQAQAAFRFAQLSTDASIKGAQAGLRAQSAKTEGAKLQTRLTSDTVGSQIRQAANQLLAVKAQAMQAEAAAGAARVAVAGAGQAIVTAQRNADVAAGAVDAADANAGRARKDLARFTKLVETEAITRQQFDAAQAASTAADAQLASARAQLGAARSQVDQARKTREIALAQSLVAQRQADAAKSQVKVADATLTLAENGRTGVLISETAVTVNRGLSGQVAAEESGAEAGAQQVALRQTQIATAQAQVEQARAALDRAKVHLHDCYLVAPCDGFVLRRTVNVGTAINPGQTVVTLTKGAEVWVMANYKETEISKVREGQAVGIEVDAFPGVSFRGQVVHVMRATGSATTLLPPDNSTGNFTKVVQRVPIKISIKQSGDDERNVLRQGMSVTAVIDTSGERSR